MASSLLISSIVVIYFQIFLLTSVGATASITTENAFVSEYKAFSLYDEFSFKHADYPGSVLHGRVKIVFPADRTTPVLRPDRSRTPFPLVVFLPGALIELNRYQWIGERIAADYGVAWVSVDILVPTPEGDLLIPMPGGLNDPQEKNPGFVALFKKLREVNWGKGVLNSCLNVDQVILGGHSWGGRVVLVDGANKGFFPNVLGAFVYAAHTEQSPGLGYIPGKTLPLEGSVPLLLMAGNSDTAIGDGLPSSFETGVNAMKYIFEEAIDSERKCYYVELKDFSQMSIVFPEDDTLHSTNTARKSDIEKASMLDEFYWIVSLFVRKYVFDDDEATNRLEAHLFDGTSPYIKVAEMKG